MFRNKTDVARYIWLEPAAISLELISHTQYKLVTDETAFTIEYDAENQITLWQDYFFGFRLYKRTNEQEDWILEIDLTG